MKCLQCSCCRRLNKTGGFCGTHVVAQPTDTCTGWLLSEKTRPLFTCTNWTRNHPSNVWNAAEGNVLPIHFSSSPSVNHQMGNRAHSQCLQSGGAFKVTGLASRWFNTFRAQSPYGNWQIDTEASQKWSNLEHMFCLAFAILAIKSSDPTAQISEFQPSIFHNLRWSFPLLPQLNPCHSSHLFLLSRHWLWVSCQGGCVRFFFFFF